MKNDGNKDEKVYKMTFASVYPHYITKLERKGRTRQEAHEIIGWLTGFDDAGIQSQIDSGATFEAFFANAPAINPAAAGIKGVICGVRVEEIKEPLMQKIRWLDKLIDEAAKGKKMEKILRDC